MKFLEKYAKYSSLVLRIVLGIAFIAHGWQKISGMEGTIGFFAGLGFPAFIAYFVAYAELLAGIAVLLGVFTRYASALIGIIMIVAIFKAKLAIGFLGGYELDLAFLAMSVSLMLTGAGEYSVDRQMNW